jgi:hypothetical protein
LGIRIRHKFKDGFYPGDLKEEDNEFPAGRGWHKSTNAGNPGEASVDRKLRVREYMFKFLVGFGRILS